MKEKIENLDFKTLDKNSVDELLKSLLELNDESLKESVLAIVDKLELDQLSTEIMPKEFEKLLKNERLIGVFGELLSEIENDEHDV